MAPTKVPMFTSGLPGPLVTLPSGAQVKFDEHQAVVCDPAVADELRSVLDCGAIAELGVCEGEAVTAPPDEAPAPAPQSEQPPAAPTPDGAGQAPAPPVAPAPAADKPAAKPATKKPAASRRPRAS